MTLEAAQTSITNPDGNASITTSGASAVQAVAAVGAGASQKSYGGGFLFNPSGSGAGILSGDNFLQDNRAFAAGPSLLILGPGTAAGSQASGLKVKRSGGTDVSGAVLALF